MNDVGDILALLAKYEPSEKTITKIGLTPAQVRRLTGQYKPVAMPTAAETRAALVHSARNARWQNCGRRGLPEYVWRAMYAEYCTGKSCEEVAEIFGGTRQSVHEIFKVRRLKLRPRHPRLQPKIDYRGVSYTPGKSGYYRATGGDRKMLHHRMWEDAHGPIPEGCQVTFKNADHTDLRLTNMECMPIADVTRYHQARHREGRAA